MSAIGRFLRGNKVSPAPACWFDCAKCGGRIVYELREKEITSYTSTVGPGRVVACQCPRCKTVYDEEYVRNIFILRDAVPCSTYKCPACNRFNIIDPEIHEERAPALIVRASDLQSLSCGDDIDDDMIKRGSIPTEHWHNPEFHICVGCHRPIKILGHESCFERYILKEAF